MKYIRIGIIVIFLIVAVIFGWNLYSDKKAVDQTYPEIQVGKEILQVPVKAGKEELLRDVIAKDAKDGDLTNRVIVESISKFVDKENHICNVTYVVADSDNNVTRKSRKIQFTDYQGPKFTLKQPLCFDIGSDTNVSDVIGAVDDYDGDISRNVKILSSTVYTNKAGEYTVKAQVTNSLGDTAKLIATVVIRQSNSLSPAISLKQNVVYLKVGDHFDAMDYIKSVKDHNQKSLPVEDVKVISSSVNMKKPGYYTVQFAYGNEEKAEDGGGTYLAVVVEGK